VTIVRGRRSIATHEASHVASLTVDNWPPIAVTANGWADEDTRGFVRLDWESRDIDDPRTLKTLLICTLLGPIADAEPCADITAWPIVPDDWAEDNEVDARLIAFIVERLDLDQVGWGQAIFEADQRRSDARFRRLVWAIAERLTDIGEIYQDELVAIAREVGER
jgi:hypothetical protein